MKIYTSFGDLAFKEFNFPDGQPHFELQTKDNAKVVTIEARIKNPTELFRVVLAASVLNRNYDHVNLDVRYLMAARMDRPIDANQPFTLDIVAHALAVLGRFHKIRILDPHSSVAGRLLEAKGVLPYDIVASVTNTIGNDVTVVIPDKGAKHRTTLLGNQSTKPLVQILKNRDMQTGKITGMTIENPGDVGKRCLIIDDICDGGATFVEAARILREAGAEKVYLYVTHGIFSKTLPLDGITNIFTTDSFHDWTLVPHCSLVCTPISMRNL